MAKFVAGLLIFFSCVAVSPSAQTSSPVPWRSTATLESSWVARTGQAVTLRSGRSQAARTGTFSIDSGGVTFRFNTGRTLQWPFTEIETFDLTNPQQLVLRSYENKSWYRPGEKDYAFRLAEPVPLAVAASLAQHVGKPSRNGLAGRDAGVFATIPARHPMHFGGSNGLLHFADDGIDYTTEKPGDSRHWRWSDIQTLANPDTYHLRVDGYRETYDFLLKEPLSRSLFDKLWDKAYAKDLNVSAEGGR